MKTIIFNLLFIQVGILGALTIDEFDQMEAQQQIRVLGNPPDSYKIGANPESLLRLYTRALESESLEVRRAAAQMSVLFIGALQAETSSLIPEFKEEYTQKFQHNLFLATGSDDSYTRMGAAQALAISSSPNEQIENLLFDLLNVEPVDEVKIAILSAMQNTSYRSAEISDRALDIFKSSQDSHAQRRARKLLGFLKDERLLPELILIAKGDSSSLAKGALLALAGYGESGEAIKPHLLEIINSPGLNSEVVNLAQVTLDSIESGKKPNTSINAINPRSLWPVNLTGQSNDSTTKNEGSSEVAEVIEETTAPEPAIEKASAEVIVTEPVEEDVEQSSNWWPWFFGIFVIVGGLGLVVRRKN